MSIGLFIHSHTRINHVHHDSLVQGQNEALIQHGAAYLLSVAPYHQ